MEEKLKQFIGMILNDSGIIFNANLDANFTGKGTVTYSGSDVNLGNSMKANEGIFNAPVTGIYYFHFQAVSDHKDRNALFANILLNGNIIASSMENTVRYFLLL